MFAAYSPLGAAPNLPGARQKGKQSTISLAAVRIQYLSLDHNRSATPWRCGRWLVQQEIPIVTQSRSAAHMAEAVDTLRWALSSSEMRRLAAARYVSTTPDLL